MSICHYCDVDGDEEHGHHYESMVQNITVCEDCIGEYVKQEILEKVYY